jgi:microcystin-dependent protein
MATLTPTPTWDDVYQYETSDLLQGGAGGIDNVQGQQLANRTAWLREKVDALIAGNLQLKGVNSYSADQTLTLSDAGALVVITGTVSRTMTLASILLGNALANNQAIVFKNKNTAVAGCIIKTFTGDGSAFDDGSTQIVLKQNDVLLVIRKNTTYYTMVVRDKTVPVGTVQAFAGTVIPDGYLLCNGAFVSRNAYPDLYDVIATTYSYGGAPVGQFQLPDLRGEFIRGFDASRGVDPSRVFGSTQDDALKAHTHGINTLLVESGTGTTVGLGDTGGATSNVTKSTGGAETRPRNVAMNFIIKF